MKERSITSLFDLAPFCFWVYNGPMQIVNLAHTQYGQIGASGTCPHCNTQKAYLRPVTGGYFEQVGGSAAQTIVNGAQCEVCKGFVLIVGRRPAQSQPAQLVNVFPLGKPEDFVAADVPAQVAEDFGEALRCEWVKAYKACVVMCRRAVQTSALELGAKGGRLIDQIDNLFATGKITEALKDFAHEVRLTGNDGAHPDKDGLAEVTGTDAKDTIEFTREYLHHVYVMPAKLKGRRAPITAAASSTPSS